MEFRLLRADEIDVRVSQLSAKGAGLLLYKDARCDMNILDEAFGIFGWQREHTLINGNLFCTVSVRDPETGEWISKQDVGTESYTEKEKGQASDSFKRACFNLGIGRELYTAPFIWWSAADMNLLNKNDRFTTFDRFRVESIEYAERKIVSVTITNTKKKITKTFESDAAAYAETNGGIKLVNFQRIRDWLKKQGISEKSVADRCGIKSLNDMTSEMWEGYTTEYKAAKKGGKK